MAELLAGGTGHSTFAPLSHSQTISIAKHLQDQICEMQARLDDFQAEYSRTKEQMQAMQQGLRKDFEAVHDLQDGLASANALVDSTRKDLARTNSNVQQLSAKQEEANNGISSLREAQKVAAMNRSKMQSEMDKCIATCNDIRAALEKQTNSEVNTLRDDFSRLTIEVRNMRDDTDTLKESAQAARDAERASALHGQSMKDDIQKTNSLMQVLDQRSAEMGRFLKKTRQIVDDHETKHTQMEENQEKLRNEVLEVFGGLKAANHEVKQVQEKLESTSNDLGATQVYLTNQQMRWDQTRQELDITKSNVRSLKDGHDMATARAQELAGQLETTKCIALDTKRGLLDTNSVVLPNLTLENLGAPIGVPRKPLTARGDMRPTNLKPLPKKVAPGGSPANKQEHRSSGAGNPEMDRMAWI